MNSRLKECLDKAVAGGELSKLEIQALFSVPVLSEEYFMILYAARSVSAEAAQGAAEVHAQVGINTGPCPRNCAFCSFASCHGIFKTATVLGLEEIIERCDHFQRAGANAIYLMMTANFDFGEFLKIGREVRAALGPEAVLFANTGDFGREGAEGLRQAGFQGIYHAVRLREGKVTLIKPETRLRTIRAAQKAGLVIATCVEPVGREHSVEELTEMTLLTRDMAPIFSGAARRIPIPGTVLACEGIVSEAEMALILAVVRLAMGYLVPLNCTHEPNGMGVLAGASILWAEEGSNPRDVREQTSRGYSVEGCQTILREAHWKVAEGPSPAALILL
ncbi:radical SAM protein [Desulfosporosinus sp. Tol-M]|nr:radical SAM protein [Desulfosporosinus sp. Tol-M]